MSTKNNIPGEFASALQGKCPRCRKGNMFNAPLLSFKSKKMNENCSHCGLHYEKEPGYFYVAMYVSYAFVVAELVAACIATYVLTGNSDSPWLYLSVALGASVALSPFNYRYSRIVLMYWLTPQFRFQEKYYLMEK